MAISNNVTQLPGELIRERRKAAGLSQQMLATLADCSIASIWLLENGYNPKVSAVRRRVLEVLARSNPEPPSP